MDSKKFNLNLGTFQDSVLFRSLFIFFFISYFVQAAVTAESAQTAGCEFMLSINDWRATAFIGLIIGILLVGFMYMYGSTIDNSFISKSKNEFYQLVFTALILVSITAIVGFMCSDVVSDLFGKEGPTFIAAESYLSRLSGYLGKTTIAIGAIGASLQLLSTVSVEGYATPSKTFEILSDPIKYVSDSTFVLYGIALSAYLLTVVQLHIIKIVPYLTLFFLVPIGLVLRSILPFRKFGGALLGAGISLYILIPFVLLLNQAMVDKYVNSDEIFEKLSCTNNFDCYSHMCEFDQSKNLKLCSPLKDVGQPCETDDQCQSGYCEQTSSGKNCSSCGGEGSVAIRCCEGFVKNPITGKCEIGKANGVECTKDSECISGICNSTSQVYSTIYVGDRTVSNEIEGGKVCIPKKSNGEKCGDWRECASRACTGAAPNEVCTKTILTESDVNYLLAASYAISETSPSAQFQVLDTQTTLLTSSYSQTIVGSASSDSTISESIRKLFDLVVVSFIAGILLPILNLTVISKGIRGLSSALGSEMDIASIWKII